MDTGGETNQIASKVVGPHAPPRAGLGDSRQLLVAFFFCRVDPMLIVDDAVPNALALRAEALRASFVDWPAPDGEVYKRVCLTRRSTPIWAGALTPPCCT